MLAILSDIHSNLEALTAALDILAHETMTSIYCAGDLVEFPEEANEVFQLLQQSKVQCVMGNNDHAYLEQLEDLLAEPESQSSTDYPKEELTIESLDFLEQLPAFLSEEDFYLVHGLPPDSFLKYIDYQSNSSLINAFDSFTQPVAFVGHTHEFKIYELTASGKIIKHPMTTDVFDLNPSSRYIVNVGSLGSTRDRENDAGWVVYDLHKKNNP